MKNIPFIFLILLIGCEVNSNENNQKLIKSATVYITFCNDKSYSLISEKIEYDLDGHITSKKNYNYDSNGKVDYWNQYKYDKLGSEVEDIFYLGDTINSITKIKRNKIDSIEAYMVYKPDNELKFTIQVLYNKNGQNYMDVGINKDSSIRFRDKYYLNSLGKQIKWERYKSDNTIDHTVNYEYDKNGNEIKNISSMGTKSEYKYNNFGKIAEEYLYDTQDTCADGTIGYLIYLKTFQYNNSNKLLKIKEFNAVEHNPKIPSKIYTYNYQFYE